ncbi:hypothetical protein LQG66_20550 [Bradyrhizobium ontarionense]|uniref:Uncharacterized protein n=1 Tax=Bradyrhizobium ontarionense TaxID=2898149 RepID=A0ABY3R4P2_9BRAD|nr:hypothetical protein [Bradyrhizobium sp. A19]UFZ01713.1 hypothetical protein LQG66_20550 [Bradyrhizobium sp. A19]
MRKLLIAAGPSEEPFRLTLQSDEDASACEQRGRRTGTGMRAKRVGSRAHGSPRPFRWARPSRAMAAIVAGLKATLSALVPADSRHGLREHDDASRDVSSTPPRLRLVSDCGRALEAPAASPIVPSAMFQDAMTPRHHVRSPRTPGAKRRRLRWR